MDLSGRTILVTGASSGIGRETAGLLSQLGAKIVLAARSRERLEQTFATLDGTGHRIEPFDLLQLAETPSWLKRIAVAGPLHGLVHSAGVALTKPLRFQEPEEISETLRMNLETAFSLAKGFRQRGVCAPNSSLVFLSSVAGLAGIPGKSAYAASKAGLIALTASLATELAREGIRVNCVAPGWVETEMTRNDAKNFTPEQYEALRRRHLLGFGQPRDVAHAIAFLLADTGRWITGTTLIADGGFTAQ